MTEHPLNPAERAAAEADGLVLECLKNSISFRLEAGAGAGKTHSLIKALKYLIDQKGRELSKRRKQIACITYTNVAKDQIDARTDSNPVIYSGTIHSFCWTLIKDFQPQLRSLIVEFDSWQEKLAGAEGVDEYRINYTLGHRKIADQEILLGHDDVLSLACALLSFQKFRRLLVDRFPILLIDEYQDTNSELVNALQRHFLDRSEGLLLGFFGDAWQKIYEEGYGAVEHSSLKFIGKKSNFRSSARIVDVLNHMRPELPQYPCDPDSGGEVNVYHTNDWPVTRRNGQHWNGDLPVIDAQRALSLMRARLVREGWEFTEDKTKILALTQRVLANQQGYSQLFNVFPFNDSFTKKRDPHIAFFADKLEPACQAYAQGHFGEMFSILGADESLVNATSDKRLWAHEFDELIHQRTTGSIGDVLDHLKACARIPFPDSLRAIDDELNASSGQAMLPEDESADCQYLRAMRAIPYQQVTALVAFIEGHTPFRTQHGVKGDQFENVLVVFGRGWNEYDFGKFLEWNGDPPLDQAVAYERYRNLFYVVCSRPQKRLALLFTQKLSARALTTLRAWVGEGSIHSLEFDH